MHVPLFAVHLSDGALATAWLASGFGGLAVMLVFAMWKVREEEIPRIGVFTAAFFVASSVHIKLGVLPTSVHLILNGLVGVILGRRAPLAIAIGLGLQYLLLQHGGYSTLGINACIVGIPALIAGALYPVLRRLRVPAFVRGVLLGGGAVAGAVVLNFLVLLLGGKDDWERLAQLVLLAHIPVVIVEGAMLGVLVSYLEKVKPEMLGSRREPPKPNTPPNEDTSW
ncbi:cobalt transporter CbiM [Gemmata sp. G18]|uniref:Cobalt transporter CbiM n=1 Tax=Gemmata palustris TaxID=2822762 RepID=A0ABS5BQ85_9BACT|nr:CbiM family transporter [Gemmata palustris]MBP3955876.1 cobalt transporter CbiM [Gemmata palustris]